MAGAPDVTVRVIGAKELRRSLKAADRDLGDLKTVHRKIGTMVMSTATPRAPRRTGKLASSLRSSPTTTKARVTSRLPYAAPVHWGVPSRGIEPQPWISAAAQRREADWTDLYRKEVQRIMDEVETT